jgi:hypothetical protein
VPAVMHRSKLTHLKASSVFFLFFNSFRLLFFIYFFSVAPRVVKHVHIEIRSERLVSL